MNKSAKVAIPVHPLAEVYRMHTGEELEVLVDSIRRNGLRDAITLDKAGRIIDGRNRNEACGIAGVEPHFETFDGDDEAIAELIHDRNSARRDLTTGQKALAFALLFPEAEQVHTGKPSPLLEVLSKSGIQSSRVSEARLILKHSSPDEIEAVKIGTTKHAAAYERAQQRDREAKAAKDENKRLVAVAAKSKSLADLVQKGTIGLDAAEAQIREDEEKSRAERQRHTGYLNDALRLFHGHAGATPEEWAASIHRSLDPEYFVGGSDVAMDGKTMRRAAATLTALADRLEAEDGS